MFSSVEHSIEWAEGILGIQVGTYAPDDSDEMDSFCIVERTGGEIDYPHDSPDITFQIWAKTGLGAETQANMLAISAKMRPMDDPHVNGMGVPEMMTYGREEGGWFVWQVSIPLNVNLLDKED